MNVAEQLGMVFAQTLAVSHVSEVDPQEGRSFC